MLRRLSSSVGWESTRTAQSKQSSRATIGVQIVVETISNCNRSGSDIRESRQLEEVVKVARQQ